METYDVIVNQPVVIDNVSTRHHYIIFAYYYRSANISHYKLHTRLSTYVFINHV